MAHIPPFSNAGLLNVPAAEPTTTTASNTNSAPGGPTTRPRYPRSGTSATVTALRYRFDRKGSERNVFEQAFSDARSLKYTLTGDFPAGMQPYISTALLNKIRVCTLETDALQSAVDRLTDPSAYELRYRDIASEVSGNMRIAGCSILCCLLPPPHNVNAVMVCKTDSWEVIRIQLRGRGEGNVLLWDSSIVPQYDRITPRAEAQRLLKEQPNILPLSLLEQLGGRSIATSSTQSNSLATHIVQKKSTTEAFFHDLSTFYIQRARYLSSAKTYDAAINFLNAIEEAVYGPTPLTTAFHMAGQDVPRSQLRELQHRLIERYLSSPEMKAEKEVDAFIAVASEIRKEGKNASLIGLLSLRHKIYELDGDSELINAFNQMSSDVFVFDKEKKKRWAFIVILPEIARKLQITKWQMFAAIKNWAMTPGKETSEDTVRHLAMIQEEMPLAALRTRHSIIVQLARRLTEPVAGM